MSKVSIVTFTLAIAVNVGLIGWDIHTGHVVAAACNGFAAGFLLGPLMTATGAS